MASIMVTLCCDDPLALNSGVPCPAASTSAPWTCRYALHGCPDDKADNFHVRSAVDRIAWPSHTPCAEATRSPSFRPPRAISMGP